MAITLTEYEIEAIKEMYDEYLNDINRPLIFTDPDDDWIAFLKSESDEELERRTKPTMSPDGDIVWSEGLKDVDLDREIRKRKLNRLKNN